jgi:hypothetical protein
MEVYQLLIKNLNINSTLKIRHSSSHRHKIENSSRKTHLLQLASLKGSGGGHQAHWKEACAGTWSTGLPACGHTALGQALEQHPKN